jgi:hypothetical protein
MMMTAIALLMVAPADPSVRIDAVPGRGYSAVVGTFDSGDFTGVMERVKVIAQQRCGRQGVRFGRHYFDSRVDTTRNVMLIENLKQNFFCFDPATDPYKPVPADWTASAAETASASVFATRFLDRLNRGDAAGMAMMDPLIEIKKADWDELRKGVIQHRESGDGTLTPQLRGWLNNPEGAAYPGAYALFSVIDDHRGIVGTCGGILLHRVRDGEYRVAQYDVQFISQALADQQGLSDAELDRLCAR